MIDKRAISMRFFSCYEDKSRHTLAKLLGVRQPTVTEWATDGRVPWNKLKYLSDSQSVSWDWLIYGKEPKKSVKKPMQPNSTQPKFDLEGINSRFLSLFQDKSQTQIALLFDVSPAAVNEWVKQKSRVPWERLDYAITAFSVRWDWLLDGLEPKYRDTQD